MKSAKRVQSPTRALRMASNKNQGHTRTRTHAHTHTHTYAQHTHIRTTYHEIPCCVEGRFRGEQKGSPQGSAAADPIGQKQCSNCRAHLFGTRSRAKTAAQRHAHPPQQFLQPQKDQRRQGEVEGEWKNICISSQPSAQRHERTHARTHAHADQPFLTEGIFCLKTRPAERISRSTSGVANATSYSISPSTT